jgi:hypothetical protein
MIDTDDYWVNNPLITPINKALMYDNDILNAAKIEQERIIKLLEDYIPSFYQLSSNTDAGKYPIEHLIELIKGEAND